VNVNGRGALHRHSERSGVLYGNHINIVRRYFVSGLKKEDIVITLLFGADENKIHLKSFTKQIKRREIK
jgi:hypothetical protein